MPDHLILRQRQVLRDLSRLVSLAECLDKNAEALDACGANVADIREAMAKQQAKKVAEVEAVFATWC